jgi:hypothetical protein
MMAFLMQVSGTNPKSATSRLYFVPQTHHCQ